MNAELLLKLLNTEDLKEALEVGSALVGAYNTIKKSEMAEGIVGIASDIQTSLDKASERSVARNIAAFKAYTDAGMTTGQAVDLICAAKYDFHRSLQKIRQSTHGSAMNVQVS